ncbi:MAG: hypothetical protein KY464_11425 [Gemmatimonadetes bacterium]|nr:hypothetical protein [Gemmatimonadota bacterium]
MPRDYHAINAAVVERADRWCAGRLVSVLEEGYDANAMGAAVVQHLHALVKL